MSKREFFLVRPADDLRVDPSAAVCDGDGDGAPSAGDGEPDADVEAAAWRSNLSGVKRSQAMQIRELEARGKLAGPLWLGLRAGAYLRLFHGDRSALGRKKTVGEKK